MPNITFKNVTYRYINKKNEEVVATDNISVTFKDDSFNVILGASGSGKTTLLRLISGLVDAYEGEILLNDTNIEKYSTGERRLAYIDQNYVLYPHMTIFDNIAFPLKNVGASRDEIIKRVTAIAEELDLKACLFRKPKYLSYGQRQRAALGRAIIKHANLYLFDEPFSNVDPQKRYEERIFIKKLMTKYHATVIYVTHDIQEALALADTIFIMDNGKIVMEGDPKTIFESDNELITSYKKMIYEEKAIKG